jgi:hypothetical protein
MITNCYTVLSLMKEGSQGYARYILQADVWAALGFSSMRAGMTNNVNYEQIASCTSPCVSFVLFSISRWSKLRCAFLHCISRRHTSCSLHLRFKHVDHSRFGKLWWLILTRMKICSASKTRNHITGNLTAHCTLQRKQ